MTRENPIGSDNDGLPADDHRIAMTGLGPNTVFYTAIIGDYDDLPTFAQYDATAQYICFSDTLTEAPAPWEVVRVEAYFEDNKVTSGFLKANAHILFDSTCLVVWLDASLKDVTLDAYTTRALLDGRSIATVPHLLRSSIAEEMLTVFDDRLEHPQRIARLERYLADSGFPDIWGLSATMLIIRDLRDPFVVEFNQVWWRCICSLSRRDQLSFDYSLWKCGLLASRIPVDWRVTNVLFRRDLHRPESDGVRAMKTDLLALDCPPEVAAARVPNLPEEYPGIRVRCSEVLDQRTSTVLHDLNQVVVQSGEPLEGNYCHFHEATISRFTPPDPRRSWKRDFLRRAISPARSVLEIGFNGGHSAAIILGQAGDRSLLAIDGGEHRYASGCAEVIRGAHAGRFDVRWGTSANILPRLQPTEVQRLDLVHIDGGHGAEVFNEDLAWFVNSVRPGCRLLVDDAYVPHIRERLLALCDGGILSEIDPGLESSGENRLYSLVSREFATQTRFVRSSENQIGSERLTEVVRQRQDKLSRVHEQNEAMAWLRVQIDDRENVIRARDEAIVWLTAQVKESANIIRARDEAIAWLKAQADDRTT